MSHTERKLSRDPIPVDLLIDIFSRVPAKSTARFRCVSKFWASLLIRPDFTELFLTKSSTRPRILFTIKAYDKLFFYSTDQPHQNCSLVATRYHTFSPKYVASEICPLRGFISCQFPESRTNMICNPVTGESLTLPNVETVYCIDHYSYLGYAPVGKTFKLLHMTTTNSFKQHLWRTIQCCKPHYPKYKGICIDGVLYYCAGVDVFRNMSMIVCFDIRSEKFSFINIDRGMVIKVPLTLINYKGTLGVVHYERNLELWFLEDAGKHKWSKHIYVLPLISKGIAFDLVILGMTRSGEILLSSYFLSDPFYMFYYNMERNILKTVRIKGLEEFKSHHSVHICPEYVEDVKLIC